MPGDDEVVLVDGVETTVVQETSSGGSPFALIGAGTIGDGEPGSGSAGQGGHPDFGAGPSGVVVDGSTGEVLGAATINPETGVVEQSGVEVTVVEETSSTREPSIPSGALAAGPGNGEVAGPPIPTQAPDPSPQRIPTAGLGPLVLPTCDDSLHCFLTFECQPGGVRIHPRTLFNLTNLGTSTVSLWWVEPRKEDGSRTAVQEVRINPGAERPGVLRVPPGTEWILIFCPSAVPPDASGKITLRFRKTT